MQISKEKLNKLFLWTIKDLENKSSEAYFGKDKTPLGICFQEMVQEFRDFYDDYVALSITDSKDQKIVNSKISLLKKIGEKYEEKLKQIINAEVVSIGFNYYGNASCLPLYVDKNLIREKVDQKKKYEFDRDFEAKIEDIVETKNGFKFRYPKDIKLLIIFGFGLFKKGLNNDEIVGLLFHEYGHALQQIVVSASLNLYSEIKANLFIEHLPDNDRLLQFFNLIRAKLFNPKRMAEKDSVSKRVAESQMDYDRDALIAEQKTVSDHNMRILFKHKKTYLSEKNSSIIGNISNFFKNLFKVCYHLVRAPIFLTVVGSQTNWGYNLNKDFLEKNIVFEQFADYMATQYGYGPDLANALAKLAVKDNDREFAHNFGAFNFIYFVPLINLMMAYYGYHDIKQKYYLYGYPTNNERYEGIYKALQFELNNNKNLSAADKAAIQEDMEKVKTIHSCTIQKKGMHYFFYKLFCKITRKSIDDKKSGANIEKNVLEVFNQAEIEYLKETKTAKVEEAEEIDLN